MLIRFRLRNYRSVEREAELTLVAADQRPGTIPLANALSDGGGLSLLPVSAVLGPNASGKSNVLRALRFVRDAVRNSHRRWEPDRPIRIEPFRLGDASPGASNFEIDLVVRNSRYRYGFELNESAVLAEWLSEYTNGEERPLFEREGPNATDYRFHPALSGPNEAIAQLTRPNSLFLSAAAQSNHEQLRPLYAWFGGMRFVGLDAFGRVGTGRHRIAELFDDAKRREELLSFLRAADFGVVGVGMEVPPSGTHESDATSGGNSREYMNRSKEDVRRPVLHHRGLGGTTHSFTLDDESQGTLAFLSLLAVVLPSLQSGTLLVVDELDSSLHALLSRDLIGLFSDPTRNSKGAQLVFSTHDTSLLQTADLQPDQIWFTEKDRHGGTRLYPLYDYTVQGDPDRQKSYLEGRYGAVPFLTLNDSLAFRSSR